MDSTAVYGIFWVAHLAFVAAMVWLYSAWDATAFLGMAAFGTIWLLALTAAAIDERNAEALEAEAPAPAMRPAHT